MLISLQNLHLNKNSINTVKEGIHELWNRNMMKIFITTVIVFIQFSFKLNSINTIKECIHELWNRNMMKIFITNAIMTWVQVPVGMHVFHINSTVFIQYAFKLNSINTIKEGIHKLWNRNMMKIFITNAIVTTPCSFSQCDDFIMVT